MRVVIAGGGFAGLQAALCLGGRREIEVTLVDRHNHHVFQPLLYQVAMAELSPADIAVPLRSVLARYRNVQVYQGSVTGLDRTSRRVHASFGTLEYDRLLLACGASHTYFGHDDWAPLAPGLKTLEQAREIRRRVLNAYEAAECEADATRRRQLLSFVVVGGGATGVELAGAIAEMARFTLAKDFRRIQPAQTRVLLVEAGARLLPSLSPALSAYAARALTELGVEVLTGVSVTEVSAGGVQLGERAVSAATVLWAAGVAAAPVAAAFGVELDRQGRILVDAGLNPPDHPEIFVAGDLAHCAGADGRMLPGNAAVAKQQGRHVARCVLADAAGRPRPAFRYRDMGQLATIGHKRAVVQMGRLELHGVPAWLVWVFAHIYYLIDYRSRLLVMLEWAWTYFTHRRGARLILGKTD
ncbi:MAG TPA: NAD(P)/FAD-dependent oxidoreductase [Rhodanobacteraceae bacterium]|nr:NAD(P)/FAD-dependent oxidoreductase [Rhodanobacteraceae bacterium]